MNGVTINGRHYWIEAPVNVRVYTLGVDFDWQRSLELSITANKIRFQEWLDNRVRERRSNWSTTGQMMIDTVYFNGIRGLEF